MNNIREWFMDNRDTLQRNGYRLFGEKRDSRKERTGFQEPPAIKLKEKRFAIPQRQPDNQYMVACLPTPKKD